MANLSRRALLGRSLIPSALALVGVKVGEKVGAKEDGSSAPSEPAAQVNALPATVQDVHTAKYEANNTEFGTAHIDGSYADCAVVFTAPESGRVLIHWSGAPRNVSSHPKPVAYLSPEVRTGDVVGSGSVVLAANNRRSVRNNLAGSETVRAGAAHLLSELTPGAQYNARILHRVTSGSGEFFHRTIIVAPAS